MCPFFDVGFYVQVWHLLAEYGDLTLLQALTNFCKIHAPPKRFCKPKVCMYIDAAPRGAARHIRSIDY